MSTTRTADWLPRMEDMGTLSSSRSSTTDEQAQQSGKSRDIYEAANRHPKTGVPLAGKAKAAIKLLDSAPLRKISKSVPALRKTVRRMNDTLRLSSPQSQASSRYDATHGEEHRVPCPNEEESHKQPQRVPSGPVPNSKLRNRSLDTQQIFKVENDLYFLTSQEREIYDILQRVGRVAYYKGLTRPAPGAAFTSVTLVHDQDVRPLLRIQEIARKMPEEDRHKLATTVETLLDQKNRYTLHLLLFEPDIRVTSSSIGTGVESPTHVKSSVRKNWRRPTSYDIIGAGLTGIRDSWIQTFRPGSRNQSAQEALGRQLLSQHESKGNRFSQRPFPTAEESEGHEEQERSPRLRGLRGGADESRRQHPGDRSIKAYARLAQGSYDQIRLADEERVPKTLWWLAGGRVSSKKKAPTAGELRQRRKAEIANRKEVGFVGTLFGIREHRPGAGQTEAPAVTGETTTAAEHTDEDAAEGQAITNENNDSETTKTAAADPGAETT